MSGAMQWQSVGGAVDSRQAAVERSFQRRTYGITTSTDRQPRDAHDTGTD